MALFNKLFSTRKTTGSKQPDHVSEQLFAFSKDQVRIVLFRECDFRGRRLLFDSNAVEKIPVTDDTEMEQGKFAEVSDGYGYIFTKPNLETNQLGEMVFGSVAMSFRGTYFKIHNLANPTRFMFSQVFPSPPASNKYRRVSASSSYNSQPNTSSSQSFEHSNTKLDDSGASSMSISERLSVNSTNSDTVLICKGHHSTPLDVPLFTKGVFRGDSGFCADYTCNHLANSFDSNLSKNFNASTLSLNCANYYKKWLRRHSMSLDRSGTSLCSSFDDSVARTSHTRSKLGLALIIEATQGQEEELGVFLMEHVAVMESILWRARRLLEIAFIKTHQFFSLMVEVANSTTQYLVNLLSGTYLSMNLWLSLSTGCDNFNSISAFNNQQNSAQGQNSNKTADLLRSSSSLIEFSVNPSKGLFFHQTSSSLNISGLFKSDWDLFHTKRKPLRCENKSFKAEKFLYEFCELLETVDGKATNFFISTLLTAVLTHHLGWVGTCLPSTNSDQNIPYNPLWGQLSDLYGAIGNPTKMAQTVITGSIQKDQIAKVINILTYFIRCCDVERNVIARSDINEDNKIVESICLKQSCIPEENYKKYEDHLRELMKTNCIFNNNNVKTENFELELKKVPKSLSKSKTKTCLTELLSVEDNSLKIEKVEKNEKKLGLKKSKTRMNLMDLKEVKGSKLNRVRSNTMLCKLDNNNERDVIDREEEGGEKCGDNVIFVLGENEKLVGLKKEKAYLDFNDQDFVKYDDQSSVKPSTSWSEKDYYNKKASTRSQSVPPEDRDALTEKEETKTSKYRYSGVKFNLQQYPQILSNYMKSKNLELSNLHFGEKGGKLGEASNIDDLITTSYTEVEGDFDESVGLQTPSNASELEFTTSDLFIQSPVVQHAKEATSVETVKHNFIKKQLPNTLVKENGCKTDNKMKVANLPMPKSVCLKSSIKSVKYTSSLMRPASDYYLPDMVLQGTTIPKHKWESNLKSDLALASQRSLIDQPVDEAVAIIANMDTWEVQLMSSHTYVVDKGSSGIRVGMSQLVANMLESLLQLWKLNVPAQYCLLHIEQMLQELCLRSKALAQLLLATEFCSMELLTNTLQLEVNDVPLLLAVASTHTPQVTQKYGLSFQ